jgi:hypothetical protein
MMIRLCTTVAAFAFAVSIPALAQQSGHRPGDHPAVVVQRLHSQQGYDYVSKFYPHPAWLYLLAEAPRPMTDHPAVLVFKRERQLEELLTKSGKPKAMLTSEH